MPNLYRLRITVLLLAAGCAAPAPHGDAAANDDGVGVITQPLPAIPLPLTAAPYVDATFTRPEIANPGDITPPGSPDIFVSTTIKGLLFEYLIQEAKGVGSATDIFLVGYDWDSYWNALQSGGSWPNPNCGDYCCSGGGSAECPGLSATCATGDCAGCPAAWSSVQDKINAGFEVKALFNRGKSKKNVRDWLKSAVGTATTYKGVRECVRGWRGVNGWTTQEKTDHGTCEDGGSCLGNKDMHVKMALIRKFESDAWPWVGSAAEYTSAITSTNFDRDQIASWNDAVAAYNDKPLYDGLKAFFQLMWDESIKSTSDLSYRAYPQAKLGFDTIDGARGVVRAYLFPRDEHMQDDINPIGGKPADVVFRILKYVQSGRVLLVASKFTNDRQLDEALKSLRALNPKVDVRMILRDDQDNHGAGGQVHGPTVDAIAATGVRVFVTTGGKQYPGGVKGVGIHHKFIMTSGRYFNNTFQRLVFTGTHNLTEAGLRNNDEVMFKIKECETAPCQQAFDWNAARTGTQVNNVVYQSYAYQWNALCDHVVDWNTGNPPAGFECKVDPATIPCFKEVCP